MTYDDDFVRLNLMIRTVNIPLVKVGLEWPPPEYVVIDPDEKRMREAHPDDPAGVVMYRVRMSRITDEQRDGMTHVGRGAEYEYVEKWPVDRQPPRNTDYAGNQPEEET